MPQEWHYSRGGQPVATVSEEALRSMIRSGDLIVSDFVWHAGMSHWDTIGNRFPELFAPNHPPVAHGYLIKHWRGDLPLAQCVFINGLLLGLFLLVATFLVADWLTTLNSNYGLAAHWIARYALIGLMMTWQLTGIWRSAAREIHAQGTVALARTAQLAVVAAWVILARAVLVNGIPAIQDSIARGKWLEAHGRWAAQIIRDGSELELSGGLGRGIADDVKAILNDTPSIKIVHLNLQSGGLVAEAMALYKLFDERGLVTYVSSNCQSACALAFIGGRERYARTGARLGFHQPSVPGYSFGALDVSGEKALYKSKGIADDFVNAVYSTPTDSMWEPNGEVLLNAGVVTSFVSGDQFGLSGFHREAKIQETKVFLEQTPIYRALRAHEPDIYREVSGVILDALSSGRSIEDVRISIAPMWVRLRSKYIPLASDQAAKAFIVHAAALAKRLQSDPVTCVGYFRDSRPQSQMALNSFYTPELRANELAVLTDLIESSTPGRPLPMAAQKDSVLTRLSSQAKDRFGTRSAKLDAISQSNSDPVSWCNSIVALLMAASELPADEARIAAVVLMAR